MATNVHSITFRWPSDPLHMRINPLGVRVTEAPLVKAACNESLVEWKLVARCEVAILSFLSSFTHRLTL